MKLRGVGVVQLARREMDWKIPTLALLSRFCILLALWLFLTIFDEERVSRQRQLSSESSCELFLCESNASGHLVVQWRNPIRNNRVVYSDDAACDVICRRHSKLWGIFD